MVRVLNEAVKGAAARAGMDAIRAYLAQSDILGVPLGTRIHRLIKRSTFRSGIRLLRYEEASYSTPV